MTIFLIIIISLLVSALVTYFAIRIYSLGVLHAVSTYAADHEIDKVKIHNVSVDIADKLEKRLKNEGTKKQATGKNPPF